MSDIKISALPTASAIGGTEVLPVVQSGTTSKVSVANLTPGLTAATETVPGTMSAADKTKLDQATAAATAGKLVVRDGSGDAAFHAVTLTTGTVSGTPSGSTDITNKAYVDATASGLTVKAAARVATTGAITLSGTQTIDGVAVIAADRVLVKDQVDATTNGIYACDAGAWTRTTDADSGTLLVTNSYIFVTAGTANFSTGWIMTTPNPITIGSSNIVWALYSSLGSIPASSITGQLISSQIANAAITTAQFAANLTPVEIVGTLPVTGNFAGRTCFLTSDNKIYRYNGSAFIASVATTDLSGTVNGSTQITAGSITATQIAANTITAAKIAANTITAGQISAGAIGTTELAVGGVTGVKIANGTITATQIAATTITADRLNISSLSAISANIGTVTAGTITGVSITSVVGSIAGFTLSASGLSATSGSYTVQLANPVFSGGFSMTYGGAQYVMLDQGTGGGRLQLGKSGVPNFIDLVGQTGFATFGGRMTSASMATDGAITKVASDGWCPIMQPGIGTGNTIEFRWNSGVQIRIDGTTILNIASTP